MKPEKTGSRVVPGEAFSWKWPRRGFGMTRIVTYEDIFGNEPFDIDVAFEKICGMRRENVVFHPVRPGSGHLVVVPIDNFSSFEEIDLMLNTRGFECSKRLDFVPDLRKLSKGRLERYKRRKTA